MPFLQIDATVLEVLVSDAVVLDPFVIGEQVRTFVGTLRSTVQPTTKRSWRFGVMCRTPTIADAVQALADGVTPRTVTGTALQSASISCLVSLEEEEILTTSESISTILVEEI